MYDGDNGPASAVATPGGPADIDARVAEQPASVDTAHPQIAAVLAQWSGSAVIASKYANICLRSGVDADELIRNRDGESQNKRTRAALRFAHASLVTRGKIEREDVSAAKRQGLSDTELLDLVTLGARVFGDSMISSYAERRR